MSRLVAAAHHASRLVLGERATAVLRARYQGYRLRHGGYRVPDAELIARHLPRGGVALDLGANIGVYTALMSEIVGPTGTVHAFEPLTSTYCALASNVSHLRNVVTWHAAVTAGSGVASMVLPDIGPKNIYWAHMAPDPPDHGSRVPALALDDLGLPRIDFIKCDVQGAEGLAFRGAERVLTASRPVILVEIADDCRKFGFTPEQNIAWLTERGWTGEHLERSDYLFTPTSS